VIVMLSGTERQAWARIEHDLRSDPEFDQAAGLARADLPRDRRRMAASVSVLEATRHGPTARVRAGAAIVALLGIGLLLAAPFTRLAVIAVAAGLLAPLAVLSLILTIGWALTGTGRRRSRESKSGSGHSQEHR
jgi:hypothetical protein